MTTRKPKAKLKNKLSKLRAFQPLNLWFVLAGATGLWLGFPNDFIQLPILVFAWPICLFCLGKRVASMRQAFVSGWICTFCGMLAAMYWLALPVHNVGGLPWPGAIACAMLICAILALQGGVFSLLVCKCPCRNPFFSAICLAFLWSLLEIFFAVTCGFPWTPLAGALVGYLWMVQTAEIFGAFGLSAVWLTAIFVIILAIPQMRLFIFAENDGMAGWRTINFLLLALGLFIIGSLALYGKVRLNGNLIATPDNGFLCLMVQGNIDQNQKWLPTFQRQSVNAYMKLTREGVENNFVQGEKPLVIWPETALPFFVETNRAWQEELRNFVVDIDCPLLFGAPGIGHGSREEIYNRAFLMNKDGQLTGSYDKVHLVPFGEYAPEWLKFDFLESLLQGVGVYSEGQSASPLRLGRLALGMLICYEGIFPWLAQERVEADANVLVDISNDGWFGNSPAPKQHLDLTLLRCIEQYRWLARATNTGISAIIDPYGRIRLSEPQFVAGFLAGMVGLETEHTLFYRHGKWLPWITLVCVCLMWFAPYVSVKRGLT